MSAQRSASAAARRVTQEEGGRWRKLRVHVSKQQRRRGLEQRAGRGAARARATLPRELCPAGGRGGQPGGGRLHRRGVARQQRGRAAQQRLSRARAHAQATQQRGALRKRVLWRPRRRSSSGSGGCERVAATARAARRARRRRAAQRRGHAPRVLMSHALRQRQRPPRGKGTSCMRTCFWRHRRRPLRVPLAAQPHASRRLARRAARARRAAPPRVSRTDSSARAVGPRPKALRSAMSFIAPGLSVLALRAVAPPVLAVGGWGVRVLRRHAWLGWYGAAQSFVPFFRRRPWQPAAAPRAAAQRLAAPRAAPRRRARRARPPARRAPPRRQPPRAAAPALSRPLRTSHPRRARRRRRPPPGGCAASRWRSTAPCAPGVARSVRS
jgi:hypothetical protein